MRGIHTFKVVRDKDWMQVFYPENENSDSGVPVYGPEDAGYGPSWRLHVPPGHGRHTRSMAAVAGASLPLAEKASDEVTSPRRRCTAAGTLPPFLFARANPFSPR